MTDQLLESPGNPIPPGARAGIMTTRDKARIRYARFTKEDDGSNGTVIILSGRNECIEKYFETVSDLAARGFSSVTLDWRGQGGSSRSCRDRMRGHIRSFDIYVRDLKQLFDEVVLPDCRPPYYVLAHSTGSLVALLAAPRIASQVQRMVLIAPLIELAGQPLSMRALRRLSGFLYYIGLGRLYMRGRVRKDTLNSFANNRLTSDEMRFRRNRAIVETHPELALGGPTIAWVHAACVAADKVCEPEFMARIRIPSLLLAAGADRIVSTPAIENYAAALRCGSLVTIDGANHELLQEADVYRQQVLAAFDAFVPGSREDV